MRTVALSLMLATACGGATTPAAPAPGAGAPAENRSRDDAPVVAVTGPRYEVRFERPAHVGDRAHVVADHVEEMDTTIARDGTPLSHKRDTRTAHLDAVSTIAAVDERGRATRIRFEVRELAADGARLPASVIELARRARKTDAEIAVDGRPASEGVRKVLDSLFKLGMDGATDDEIFGPKGPQPIGAHWGIDGGRAIASFRDDGLEVTSVSGDVWLAGVSAVDGVECLTVQATLDLRGMTVPNLPAGSETLETRARAETRAVRPRDDARGTAIDQATTTTSFQVRVPAPDGTPRLVTVNGKDTKEARETRL